MTPGDRAPEVDPRALAGHRIVVTRAEHQAGELAERFAAAGATVELLPLLAVVPPDDPEPLRAALGRLDSWEWLALTSANTVEAIAPIVAEAWDRPWPRSLRVAAIGPATAAAAEEAGWPVHLRAERSRGEGLAARMVATDETAMRRRGVLLPQAADAREALERELTAAGARVTAVTAYAKRLPPDAPERAALLFCDAPLGWVTFTSPRIVRAFVELLGESWPARREELRAVSIGPVTSGELERHGVTPAAEARRPGAAEMVAAVVRAVRSGSPPSRT